MKTMNLEWSCDWEPRKIGMVQSQLQRIFSQFGGVANIGQLRISVSGEPEIKPRVLKLECRAYRNKEKRVCGHIWEAPNFEPCPECGNRPGVRKYEAAVVDAVKIPEPVAEPVQTPTY